MTKKRRGARRQEDARDDNINTSILDDWTLRSFRCTSHKDQRRYYVVVTPEQAGIDDTRVIKRNVYLHLHNGFEYDFLFGFGWGALERAGVLRRVYAEERRQRRHPWTWR